MSELYDECHRLFSYDAETGSLIRKVSILNIWGGPHNKPKTKKGDIVGCLNGKGYLRVIIQKKEYQIHRLAWLMQTGKMPVDDIDHINGIKTDNRMFNLRLCSDVENMRNRGKQLNNKTGFKGVSLNGDSKKNPYRAAIRHHRKTIYLGYYKTPELAYEAYCRACYELHGEFGRVA